MKKISLLLKMIFVCCVLTHAQQGVSINTDGSVADSSAMLEIKSTNKGLLIPRLTAVQKNSVVKPATGLLVYQTDSPVGFYYYNGASWTPLSSTVSGPLTEWATTGNSGTDSTNFIGTTDSLPLVGKVNGQQVFKFSYNVRSAAMGLNAGKVNVAVDNTFIGNEAGRSNTTGPNNTFIGAYAGRDNTTGDANLFAGYASGLSNTTGRFNQFMGWGAGRVNTSGSANFFIGAEAGAQNTTASNNQFVGHGAGHNNTTGSNNLFIGYEAGSQGKTGNYNLFIGYRAGFASDGAYNTFLGYQAGYSNTTGLLNYFSGYQAGYSNTTGAYNVFVGPHAGGANVTSSENVMVGYASGLNNLASGNHFLGYTAGYSNTTGAGNLFTGYRAGYSNTTGSGNNFSGYEAGYSNVTGGNNTSTGYRAGFKNNGGNNVFLGFATGFDNLSGSGNVFLGYNAGFGETGSNKLYIDNNSTSAPLIYGEFNNNLARVNGNLQVYKPAASGISILNLKEFGSAGAKVAYTNTAMSQYWYTYSLPNPSNPDDAYFSFNYNYGSGVNQPLIILGSGDAFLNGNFYELSDQRLKKNLAPLTGTLARVSKLNAYTYDWIDSIKSKGQQIGLVAQEVEKEFPQLVQEHEGRKTVSYSHMVPVLLQAIKEQQAQIDELQSSKYEVQELKQQVEKLQQVVNSMAASHK